MKLATDLLEQARRAAVQRWFSQTETKIVCQTFLKSDFPKPASLKGFKPGPELLAIAHNFVRLQEARHEADDDVAATWTRWSAQLQIDLAQEAFAMFAAVRGTEQANVFLLSLLLWKNWEKERP